MTFLSMLLGRRPKASMVWSQSPRASERALTLVCKLFILEQVSAQRAEAELQISAQRSAQRAKVILRIASKILSKNKVIVSIISVIVIIVTIVSNVVMFVVVVSNVVRPVNLQNVGYLVS